MRYIKTYEHLISNTILPQIGEYVICAPVYVNANNEYADKINNFLIKFKNSIYRICKYEPGDVSPYWLENILNNGDNYWSALGNDYIKISEEEAKQELLKHKYHI